MKLGKLIVIDGLDGSGKSTQSDLLVEHLTKIDNKVKLISYPNYANKSSTLVKMYLDGEISPNADDVNAFAASSFYSIDRYISYKLEWEKLFNEGYTIIASRYVSSNAIHQMSKLPQSEWDKYLEWISDYEYNKLGLPRPDKTIFLKMSLEASDKLLMSRYDGDESKKDIHENNMDYLARCYRSADYVANKENWSVINCCKDGQPHSVEYIFNEILKEL